MTKAELEAAHARVRSELFLLEKAHKKLQAQTADLVVQLRKEHEVVSWALSVVQNQAQQVGVLATALQESR